MEILVGLMCDSVNGRMDVWLNGRMFDLMTYSMEVSMDVFVIEWVDVGWMGENMNGRLG